MKKSLTFCLLVLVLIPTVNAVYFFPNYESNRAITFVSRYDSTSMDETTLDYYEHLKKNYSVYIVKDSWVSQNKDEWKNAYKNSDLIFVISLSDSVSIPVTTTSTTSTTTSSTTSTVESETTTTIESTTTTTRSQLESYSNSFCQNLGAILTKDKGIIFADNSFAHNTTFKSCIFDSPFNLISPLINDTGFISDNTQLAANKVRISKLNEITKGYGLAQYFLGEYNTIYVVNRSAEGINFGYVTGDPDGPSSLPSKDYSFLKVWEGLGYRAGIWGIKTSELDCVGCLGWRLFDQLLVWASNTSDVGYKIITNKESYKPGERVRINITSPADITIITGQMMHPDGKNYTLAFQGSGKKWNSLYLLEEDYQTGNYKIMVNADGSQRFKDIEVKAFSVDLSINNETEEIEISVEVTDKPEDVDVFNITIRVLAPSGKTKSEVFEDTDNAVMYYNVTESGTFYVYVEAQDPNGRKEYIDGNFSYFLEISVIPNVTLTPKNITRSLNEPKNLTFLIVRINNDGNVNLTNVTIHREGEIADLIELRNTTLSDIETNSSRTFTFNISVPDQGGVYTGSLRISFDQGDLDLPIRIELKYIGLLTITPQSYTKWVPVDHSETIEFNLKNGGKGDVTITSVSIIGELTSWTSISEKPSRVLPERSASLKILLVTTGVQPTDLTKQISGTLKIVTNQGNYSDIPILITVVGDISDDLDSLFGELSSVDRDIANLESRTDVTDLKSRSTNIRSEIEAAEALYNGEEYDKAISKLNSAKSNIASLRSDVEQKRQELEEKKSQYLKYIMIFIGVVVGMIVLLFLLKKIRRPKKATGEYDYLYKKWRR